MKRIWLLECIMILAVFGFGQIARSQSDVVSTKHNLSISGPGPIKAATETRVCVFCHTPHNASPQSPLWNRDIEPQNYVLYTSPTLKATSIPQPYGPTKLCLTCHDGTIAMGTVVNPVEGISMVGGGGLPAGDLANFGLDLSGHHPVSFSYSSSLPNPELATPPPAHLAFGATDEIHCNTCHDPHSDRFEKFLVEDNRYSKLCTECHNIPEWAASSHATSTVSVAGILPIPPKNYPTWTQMAEWGCETCHTPHFAQTAQQLLNFTDLPPQPFSCTSAGCHSSDPGPPHAPSGSAVQRTGVTGNTTGVADIAGQIKKASAHHEDLQLLSPGRTRTTTDVTSVRCGDCHNPHITQAAEASPPNVTGLLRGVTGVDRNGVAVDPASYEYEVCLKCHGDNASGFAYVHRVVDSINTRLEFDPSNQSYHPVITLAQNLQVPSVPSSLSPSMNASDMIYCSSCHADDNDVSKGPHGSDFPPILKARYETADNTPENFDNYALCYTCHDRNSILSDASFAKKIAGTTASGGGHSGHLMAGAPCSACHDPHGVNAGQAGTSTGSHTSLINFDTAIVQPVSGAQYPIYNDTGTFSGGCTLVCHGKLHEGLTYP